MYDDEKLKKKKKKKKKKQINAINKKNNFNFNNRTFLTWAISHSFQVSGTESQEVPETCIKMRQ